MQTISFNCKDIKLKILTLFKKIDKLTIKREFDCLLNKEENCAKFLQLSN